MAVASRAARAPPCLKRAGTGAIVHCARVWESWVDPSPQGTAYERQPAPPLCSQPRRPLATMPEDVETGGQPQLRRGVSKTGRMAEFGCDILLRGPAAPCYSLQSWAHARKRSLEWQAARCAPPGRSCRCCRRYRRRSRVAVAAVGPLSMHGCCACISRLMWALCRRTIALQAANGSRLGSKLSHPLAQTLPVPRLRDADRCATRLPMRLPCCLLQHC